MNIAAREPVATRELRQAARQKRGPILLGLLGVFAPLLALLIAFSMSSPWTTSAEIGRFVFEAIFTLALGIAVIVGVTAAASSVASEREGHTWEAVLLSGLRPSAIVRGKFLSAFAQAALYLFALAPSAALSFVVGGVAVTEIVLALGLVLCVAAVAVLFGLALSSFARTARGALAGALVATLVAFPTVYAVFMGIGYMARNITSDFDARGASWLAHAIVAAPFGARSFVLFVLDPLLVLVVPGWLIFEVTKANLSDPSDDRSSGLRRWYVLGTLLLVGGAVATLFAVPNQRDAVTIALLVIMAVHLGFTSVVFGGEPLGPSRRLLHRRVNEPLTLVRRILAPGVVPATVLHACVGAGALAIVYGAGASLTREHAYFVNECAAYAIAFHLFIAGATGALTARFQRPTIVRVVVIAGTLALAGLPFVVSAIGRIVTTGGSGGWRMVEAVSPLFPLVDGARWADDVSVGCARAATVGYGLAGVLLVVLTWALARRARPAF